MHVGVFVVVVGAAAATIACGPRPEAQPAPPMRTVEPTPAVSAVRAAVALPPNADGDPSCPVADAWGKDPFGEGILVTHLSDDTEPVTVLVRTNTGTDVAQRAVLGLGELRLFEFPDVDLSAVSEVLIMTNTLRCYVSADPAAMG